MDLASTFEGFKIANNQAPQPIAMMGYVLQSTLVPVGVAIVREKRPKSPDGSILMAIPLGLGLKVSWLAEPGILYVDGNVVAVGAAFAKKTSHSSRIIYDDFVVTSTTVPPVIVEALGGSPKVEFTAFENNWFEAVAKAVALPEYTRLRACEQLSRALVAEEHLRPWPEFHGTKTEAEMGAMIEALRKTYRSETPEE